MVFQHLSDLFFITKWRIEKLTLHTCIRLYSSLIPKKVQAFLDDGEEENYSAKFLGKLITCALILPVCYKFFSSYMPFGFWEFWHLPKDNFITTLLRFWPLFVWGIILQSITSFTTLNSYNTNKYAEHILIYRIIKSVFTGVKEEITFRWLFFLLAIPGARISNYIFFGFAGFGIPEFIHNWITGPIANLFSLGLMHDLILNPKGWYLGFALLATNAFFRDGHKYLGLAGFINAWFGGLVLFYAALTYGLPLAIVLHTSYNATVSIVLYVDSVLERKFA